MHTHTHTQTHIPNCQTSTTKNTRNPLPAVCQGGKLLFVRLLFASCRAEIVLECEGHADLLHARVEMENSTKKVPFFYL